MFSQSLALQSVRLPLMQLPQDTPKQPTQGERAGQKVTRFWYSDQAGQNNPRNDECPYWMACPASCSILAKRNNVLWMRLICSRGGGRNKRVRKVTESPHGETSLLTIILSSKSNGAQLRPFPSRQIRGPLKTGAIYKNTLSSCRKKPPTIT